MRITDEQQAIVRHSYGPALVFAVAGAGKTTTMAHRIERLVREEVFAPERILATSFSRATVADIKKALSAWPHCNSVRVTTLHAVGLKVLHVAHSLGFTPSFQQDTEGALIGVFWDIVKEARQQEVDYAGELNNVDKDDFFSYVGASKGNLRFPDFSKLQLPPPHRHTASQALAPEDGPNWYLDLYRRFEERRRALRLVSFDDMLSDSWELLVSYPPLRSWFQNQYHCVLVDEYQDVSLVQDQLLDLMTTKHRNLMAIGDDDQTIYEWRGASPRFILGFESKYRAKTYLISDNFRSYAKHLVLANHVIQHNWHRHPKRLSPTRGLGGTLTIEPYGTREGMADLMVQTIKEAQRQGRSLSEMVVLIRTYAQTPILENALMKAGLAYHIIGSQPFYARPEVRTLLAYLRLELAERRSKDGQVLNSPELKMLVRDWEHISNRPNRYQKSELIASISQSIQAQRCSLQQAIGLNLSLASNPGPLEDLSHLLDRLATAVETLPCQKLVGELVQELDYLSYLRKHSGLSENGKAKADTVEQFQAYVARFASAGELLKAMEELGKAELGQKQEREALTITTIFRAKGLEWPVVMVPDCAREQYPADYDDPEESRRLFYVALSRPKEQLHLFVRADAPTPFLLEADYKNVLNRLHVVSRALSKPLETWSTYDALAVARYRQHLNLGRFIEHWWAEAPVERARLAALMVRLCEAASRLGIEPHLRLSPDERAFWHGLRNGHEPDDLPQRFDDLIQYIGSQKGRTSSSAGTSSASKRGRRSHARAGQDRTEQSNTLRSGQKVRHPAYGVGTVIRVYKSGEHEVAHIRFNGGSKHISVKYGMLQLA